MFQIAERERRADILRLRRRFLKDKEKESIKFAKKEIQSQRSERVDLFFIFIVDTLLCDNFFSYYALDILLFCVFCRREEQI